MFFLRRRIKGKKSTAVRVSAVLCKWVSSINELRYELRITKNKCSFSL